MTARIAVIPGDGIGRDVVAEAVRVLHAIGGVDLEELPWSADHYLKTGVTLPSDGYETLRLFDAIFVGALGDPRVPDNRHARDILLGTRFVLDLYVNYRPVRLLDAPTGTRSPHPPAPSPSMLTLRCQTALPRVTSPGRAPG